jgi:phage-related baseplate assembly protein
MASATTKNEATAAAAVSALQGRVAQLEVTLATLVRITVLAYEAEGLPVPPVLRVWQAQHVAETARPVAGHASHLQARRARPRASYLQVVR